MNMRNGSCATLLAIGLLSPLGCGAGGDAIGSVSEELTSASVAHMAPAGMVENQLNGAAPIESSSSTDGKKPEPPTRPLPSSPNAIP